MRKGKLNAQKIFIVFLTFLLSSSIFVYSDKKVNVKAETINQRWGPYTSNGQFIVPTSGIYKLETWGGSGAGWKQSNYSPSYGGKGGYAAGETFLSVGTVLYYNVNYGGGNSGSSYGQSGGGASDFRLGGNTLYNRILVAGGGGGGAANYNINGGAGGNLIACSGGYNYVGFAIYGGSGGTQTSGGTGGGQPGDYGHIYGYPGNSGSLGQGASSVSQSGTYPMQNSGAGGGGSSYTGTLLNTSTIDGNNIQPSPSESGTQTGNVTASIAISLLVDDTSPTVTLTASNTSPTNQPVTVTVNATDNVGVSQIKWASGNQPTSYFSNAGTVLTGNTFIINTSGVYTVYAVDTSGNTAIQTINISNIYSLSNPTLSINNATSNTMDVNITDSNILPVQYQITTTISGQKYYVTSSGTLSTSQQNITLSNKKITVTGLNPNTTYTFQACAIYNTVTSSLSSPVSGTTIVAVPTGITCTPSDNSVTVSWSQVAGASVYYISNDGVNNIGSTSTNSYTQTGLSPGSQYNYYIKAGNANGSSRWSSVVYVITILDTPVNVVATSSQGSITISWNPVTGATGYDVNVDGNISSTANTTMTITGLDSGTKHSYDVRAKNAVTTSNWSLQGNKLTNITPPLTPSNLSALASNSTITLAWDSSAEATTYEINADGNILNIGIGTTYAVTGLLPETDHTYMVRALNSGSKSEWSVPIQVATKAISSNVPLNLTAAATDTAITISWDAVQNAASYDVEISNPSDANNAVTDINVTSTAYTYDLSRVPINTEITFKVRAEVDGIPSDWCDAVTVISGGNPTGAPQNVAAIPTDKSVALCWDHLSNATSYDIEENGIIVGNVVNSVNFTRTELTPNTQYNYRIRGENSSGTGEWSNSIAVTTLSIVPLGVPGNIIASPTENSISLVWNTVNDASSYDVEINGGSTPQNVSGTTLILSNLSPSTAYSFRVRAVNTNGTGAWSNVITISTLQIGQANGPGSASATITENLVQNGEFTLLFNTSDVQNLSSTTFTVNYDPNALTVEDLCATTPLADLTTGNIPGTDLTVTSFDTQSETIVYKLNAAVSQGQSYSGVFTAIKFKGNTNGQSNIKFTVNQGGN